MSPIKKPNRLSAFAVTAPGLEPICAAELEALGIRGRVEDGGVSWNGEMKSVVRANVWLRTASRVLVRVAEFKAKAFYELELHAKQVPWARFVARGGHVEFRVTCRKSKLYHSDAVAERFARAVQRAVADVEVGTGADSDDAGAVEVKSQLFVVRFLHDVCTVSADTSGALLHFRGYRQELAKAPLRETLAAAMLLGAGWRGDAPFTDPMCGSGTLPIEAALIARRMAPGRARAFAFQRWPTANEPVWRAVLEEAHAGELSRSPVEITGADRDAGAIAASRSNAERAGVANDVIFLQQSISALAPAEPPGLVLANPPYGVRIGETASLKNLYAQIGNVMRKQRGGWTLGLLSADRALERQVGLPLEERFRTTNGGIPVRLVTAAPAGSTT